MIPPPTERQKRPQDGISWVQKVAAVEIGFCGAPGCLGGTWIYIEGRSTSMEQRRAHEGGGRAQGGRRASHPREPLAAPPTYFFLLYISIYPENIREHHETLFPPPQPSVPVRSHLGFFSGAPPEGESITEGFYINTIASPMKCE